MILNSIQHTNIYSNYPVSPVRQVSFTADRERAPFYPETLETIDSVYRDYKKSLCETSISDIKSTALSLSNELQMPKKDVLKAMQLVTQFSNMKSLKVISEAITKHNLSFLGDADMSLQFYTLGLGLDSKNKKNFSSESGIHRSLLYVFDKKRLAPINYDKNGPIGIILDDEKISQLEEIKQTQPVEYEKIKKSKDLKFFYISGWETGIPVIDRTKSLEDTTRELLIKAKKENKPIEKVIDEPLIDRIKDLGLKPVIIKNENPATELGVYNQMKADQINKNQLANIIEANTISRVSGISNVSDAKKATFNDKTAKYLESTLCVYSPEKMSQDLKKMHEKIMDYANSQGKDVLYVRPQKDLKSTDYVYYSYKKINNIEPSKFVSINSLNDYNELYPDKPKITPKNTLLVFLDDCTISGDSINTIRTVILREAHISEYYSLLFANLKGTEKAVQEFHFNKDYNPADLLTIDTINLEPLKYNESLKKIIGEPSYTKNASTIIFPYMAPDNNSEFASNIALLHSPKYTSHNFSAEKNKKDESLLQEYYYTGSKTMNAKVKETSINYINIIGSNPDTIEKVSCPQTEKSFWEKLKSMIFE